MKIDKIIQESIEKVLSESNMHVLYHNMDVYGLIDMIEENRLYFSESDALSQTEYRDNAPYYLSLTRYKSPYEGYQDYNPCEVRLTINNDKFQSIMRKATKPFELFSPKRLGSAELNTTQSAKESYRNSYHMYFNGGGWDFENAEPSEEYEAKYQGMRPSTFAEAEETLNVNVPYIDNPLRFIERIDFWFDIKATNVWREEYEELLNKHPEWKKNHTFS